MRIFSKITSFVSAHKFVSLIIIILAGGSVYAGYQKISSPVELPRYVLAAAVKGTVVASVTGTGQVSTSNQIDITPKASGELTQLLAKSGQVVHQGDIIARIDSRDAQKTVRDAEVNLSSARLSYDKLVQATDALTLLQSQNAVTQARDTLSKLLVSQETAREGNQESLNQYQDKLQQAYDDAFTAVSDAFLDLPSVMTGLHDVLYGTDLLTGQANIDYYADAVTSYDDAIEDYRANTAASYTNAENSFDQTFAEYKQASRQDSPEEIEQLLTHAYATTKIIADAIKNANDYLQLFKDVFTERVGTPPALADTHLASLGSFTGTSNGHLSSLLSISRSIQDNKDGISSTQRDALTLEKNQPLDRAAAEQTIKEKEASFAKLKAGTDPLDLATSKLTIQQRENALADAREKLVDYTVRAPFEGTIASVPVKQGDSVSSGTVIATLVTQQHIAVVSLNEVDVARVALDQKATLTFDAIEDLSITGTVAEIDTIGTVTQGVVNYDVTIAFDAQDERVKSGMSVSAAIVTDVRQDVIVVPSAAVKSEGADSYVETLDGISPEEASATVASASAPQRIQVQTGLSDDTSTEIIEGLSEGDQVIVRTITASTNQAAQQASNSLLGGAGGRSFGGATGAVRVQSR